MSVRATTLIFYASIFFIMMVIHELALEGASKAFPELDALASAVTLFQFGSCFLLPLILSRGEAAKHFPRTINDATPYIKLSLLVAGATALATRSLVYVSYPTKVVLKSAKLIPTMLVSSFLRPRQQDSGSGSSSHHRQQQQQPLYGFADYAAALLLCAGAAGFSFSGTTTTAATTATSTTASGIDTRTESSSSSSSSLIISTERFGMCLLLVSLMCDALVPNLQQRLMAFRPTVTTTSTMTKSSKSTAAMPTNPSSSSSSFEAGAAPAISSSSSSLPSSSLSSAMSESSSSSSSSSSNNTVGKGGDSSGGNGLSAMELMVNVNGVGCVGLLLYMGISGSLGSALSAATASPVLLSYLSLVGLGLGSAVLAYTRLIKAAGPVVAVGVATLRKVVTMVLSYVVYPDKPLTSGHVASGVCVLAGLLLSEVTRRRGGGGGGGGGTGGVVNTGTGERSGLSGLSSESCLDSAPFTAATTGVAGGSGGIKAPPRRSSRLLPP